MKVLSLLFIIFIVSVDCIAQKEIIYTFDQPVRDSLRNGMKFYADVLKKDRRELKLYLVLIERENAVELFLQEYSQLPQSGLLDLIKSSTRKLNNDSIEIPILFPSDKLSVQFQKDKISEVPLAGYYLKIAFENYRQKVSQVSILY